MTQLVKVQIIQATSDRWRRTEDFLISSLQTHFSTTAGQIHHWAFSADMLIDPLLTINTWQYIHELCENSKWSNKNVKWLHSISCDLAW